MRLPRLLLATSVLELALLAAMMLVTVFASNFNPWIVLAMQVCVPLTAYSCPFSCICLFVCAIASQHTLNQLR